MSIVDDFIQEFQKASPIFSDSIIKNRLNNPNQFDQFASLMLNWARQYLGNGYHEHLIDSYLDFTYDVNQAQLKYESTGRYENSTYSEVAEKTYLSAEFMNSYHWGVFITTFAWPHHLEICNILEKNFLPLATNNIHPGASILDLGCGSGVWHQLIRNISEVPDLSVTAVDISPHTIQTSEGMAQSSSLHTNINYILGDALLYKNESHTKFDIGISCFLLEHLEKPLQLLTNLYDNLSNDSYAFVTCAISAAEIDHIYEFKKESEPIILAEEAGFRVLYSVSVSAHENGGPSGLIPRSFVMILRKLRT
ncbi:MAG: class I SAM-dependent methyltransferase [Fibrobacterales bacterium]